jgi:hypothetical protein
VFNAERTLLLTVLNLRVLLLESELISKMELTGKYVCEDRKYMELAHDRVEGGL